MEIDMTSNFAAPAFSMAPGGPRTLDYNVAILVPVWSSQQSKWAVA